MTPDGKNGFIVRYSNKDIMEKIEHIIEDVQEMKGILSGEVTKINGTLSKGTGKINWNRKMIIGCYAFTFALLLTGLAIIL